MRKRLIYGLLVIIAVSVVAAACAAPKPTPTAVPQPTATAVPTPTPSVGPTPTPGPTVAPTVRPTPTVGPTATPSKVYKWKLATYVGTSTLSPAVNRLAKSVDERSGGRLKIDVLEEGQHPLAAQDYLSAIRDRLFDAGFQSPGYFSADEPLGGLMELPFMLAGTRGTGQEEFYDMWDALRPISWDRLMDKYNQMTLLFWTWGVLVPHANKHILSFKDAQGLKLRGTGKLTVDAIIAMGSVGVSMTFADFMPALQRGVVDGLLMSLDPMYSYGMYETIKYTTYAQFMHEPAAITVNKDAFNELPKDLQNILLEVAKEEDAWGRKYFMEVEALGALKGIADYGARIVAMPPDFQRELAKRERPLWDEWAAKAGPSGRELLDKMIAFHEDWVSTHK